MNFARQAPLTMALLFVTAAAASAASFVAGERTRIPQDLRWRRTSVTITVSGSLLGNESAIKPGSDVRGAIDRAVRTWESVTGLELRVVWSEKESVSPAANSGDGVNLLTIAPSPENLFALGEDRAAAAKTRVFFTRFGAITEADVLLNPLSQFSTDGSVGTFDLESTLTHEFGHLLGLDHSPSIASTMYPFQARNGTGNSPAFTQRTLSEDDRTQVSARYAATSPECCGSVAGRVSAPEGEFGEDAAVWLEEPGSGRLVAARSVSRDGSFSIRGVRPGAYRLRVQATAADGTWFGSGDLGPVALRRGRGVRVEHQLATGPVPVAAGIGVAGQIGLLPVAVDRGASLDLYFGSRSGLPTEITAVGDRLGVWRTRGDPIDFGDGITARPFRVYTAQETGDGDYSLRLDGPSGPPVFVIGCLTVDRFPNPWSIIVPD